MEIKSHGVMSENKSSQVNNLKDYISLKTGSAGNELMNALLEDITQLSHLLTAELVLIPHLLLLNQKWDVYKVWEQGENSSTRDDIETKPIKTIDELRRGAHVVIGDNKAYKAINTCNISLNWFQEMCYKGNFEAPDLTQTYDS